MPDPKMQIADKPLTGVNQGDAVIRPSRLPSYLQFPLLVLLSLALSTLLYSFTADYTAGDLASVSRRLDLWSEVGALVGWRTLELGLGWFGNYDGYDLAALSILSHGPPLYLLGAFYEVRKTTILLSLVIDSLATYIPFRLLRPLSLAHSASTSRASRAVANKYIITSTSIQIYTTILAANIYALTLYTTYASYLPVYLVTYFSNIPSITAAHSSTLVTLFPLTFVLGLAARSFIFTPAMAVISLVSDDGRSAFNPVTATLGETFWYNIWGFSKRTKVVIQRTTALVLVTGVNTFVQTYVTLEGVEAIGALAYSAPWVIAGGITGVVFGIIGAE